MIFLTGGTGFLGRHLVAALCQAGYALRILTRQPQAHTWLQHYPQVEVVTGDLRDYPVVHAAMQGCTQVIHAAGLFSMWGDAHKFNKTNSSGTEHVMAAAQAEGVQRVVYVSTVAVIGNPQPGVIIDENHPPRPADPYQASKLQAEQVVLRYVRDEGMDAVILRPGAYYGPLGEYAFNRLFFTDAMRGLLMHVDGGHYTIFPVYIGDVARGVILGLERGQRGEIYNICGECLSHREVFKIVSQEANLYFPPLILPGILGRNFSRVLELVSNITGREPFYPINLRSYVFNDWRVSSDKARRELGFAPLSFREGAARTVAWYKAGRPDWLPELACDASNVSKFEEVAQL